MTADPVDAALERAAAELSDEDRQAFIRVMHEGLATFDAAVGPDDKVIEIEAALADVAPSARLEAAERFASRRRVFVLGRRAGDLLRAFAAGEDVHAAAEALLDEIQAALEAETDEELRGQLGDHATECRYILSGGTGPNSLRGAKLV